MPQSSPPPKPSAFTPFLRRFTDEKARDLEEIRQLYGRVRALHAASPYSQEDALRSWVSALISEIDPPEGVHEPFWIAVCCLLEEEGPIFELPEPDFDHLSLREQVDLRRFLYAKEYFHAHEEKIVSLVHAAVVRIFSVLREHVPRSADASIFTVPLIHTFPHPHQMIDGLLEEFWSEEYKDAGLFVNVTNRLYRNLCAVSGVADPFKPKRPLLRAAQNKAPLPELVESYVGGTPFRSLFLFPVPLHFTYEERFSHMHVVGGSGAGKTQLLQNLIRADLQADEPPSLVIVDSQGDLINNLSHLAVFDGALKDRLILITPKDIDHSPALNIFDVNRKRLGQYGTVEKEQVVAGVIETFDYLFSGLLGADLTAKQGVFFRYVARLLLAIPDTLGRNATILDMIELMNDPLPYREAIQSLPPIQRQFFERDFAAKTFQQTKEQIRYRLHAILENPTIAKLFTSPETKLDLFSELNSGSIVLVDTAKDFLKGASSHFGRIFISLVLQAILERAAIPERERKPAFLIVDEAASYFDTNIDDLLTEARKYRLGCVFAHQFLDQATPSLRASLAANTAIKMVGGVSTSDARSLAPDLRTTADFILGQPRLHFACYIRNVTPSAVSVPVEAGALEREAHMSDHAYQALRRRNRERVCLSGAEGYERPREPGTPPRSPHAGNPEAGVSESSGGARQRESGTSGDTPLRDTGSAASTEW